MTKKKKKENRNGEWREVRCSDKRTDGWTNRDRIWRNKCSELMKNNVIREEL